MATVINIYIKPLQIQKGDIYQRGDLSNKLTRHNDARVWRLAEQLPVHGEGVQSVGKPSSPGGDHLQNLFAFHGR